MNRVIKSFAAKKIAFAVVLLLGSLSFSIPAYAAQCLYNHSATALNVKWYNASGNKDSNASNSSLSYGKQACQNNDKIGYVVVTCNDCSLAADMAKAAVITGGIAATMACIAGTAGECLEQVPDAADIISQFVDMIPAPEKGKFTAVIQKGETVYVNGDAFGLTYNHNKR